MTFAKDRVLKNVIVLNFKPMHKFLTLGFLSFFLSVFCVAQHLNSNRNLFYQQEWENHKMTWHEKTRSPLITDSTIDIKFYHLDLQIAIDSHYIGGSVRIKLQPTINNLSSLTLNLHSSMMVDSVTMDAASYSSMNDILSIGLTNNYNIGDDIDIKIYYHGIPILANATKGLRYETHGANEPIIATLSTPFLSHYWWPCKDGPTDKADSVYIDIAIKDSVVHGIPLMAVSNGLLDDVDSSSGFQKIFKWKHRYPIVPYYVMAAISNYRTIQQTYTGANSTFPLIYYVFDSTYNQSLLGISQIPYALDKFIDLFGDYPFKNEKYGMTELGYYGAIENQTNTITNSMDTSWYYTSVHEMAHQWFGDIITCADWHHGWLNEGFASYSEALVSEHLNGFSSYKNYMAGFEWYSGGTIYLPQDTSAFNIFQGIIYFKGAYVLHMLRGVLGDSLFFNCLKTYVTSSQFRYRHANTEDFRQVCESVTSQNLGYFFDQWIYDKYYPKYRYNYRSQPSSSSTAVTINQQQGTSNGWRPIFKMPLQMKFQFASNPDTLITVMNDQQSQTYFFNFPDSVIHLSIDPDKWVLKNLIFDPSINVGINNTNDQPHLEVYPNPANHLITVSSSSNLKNSNYSISDLSGRVLLVGTLISNNTTINIADFPSGLYFLKIGNEKLYTYKVFKQ